MTDKNRREWIKTAAMGAVGITISLGSLYIILRRDAIGRLEKANDEARLVMEGLAQGKPLNEFSKECEHLLSTVPVQGSACICDIREESMGILFIDRAAGMITAWTGPAIDIDSDDADVAFKLKRAGIYTKGNKTLSREEMDNIYDEGEREIKREFKQMSERNRPKKPQPKGHPGGQIL